MNNNLSYKPIIFQYVQINRILFLKHYYNELKKCIFKILLQYVKAKI